MYAEFSRILVSITSILLLFGIYDQAIKMWRTKSVKDLSMLLIVVLLLDTAAYLNYGYVISEWPIKLMGFASTPAVIAMTVGYFRFRSGKGKGNA